MSWWDIVAGGSLVGCGLACMCTCYLRGRIDGVRECCRILEEYRESGLKSGASMGKEQNHE